MILNLKRYISLLLVLMLLIGIVPTVYASETTTDSTVPEEIISEVTEASDPTEPTEPTEPPNEDPAGIDTEISVMAASDNAVVLSASTTSNVLLFDQASPNYTTYLSSQIAVTYKPNGTDSSVTAYIKNLGWHFARIDGVSYPDDPIYCIEPCKNFAASTSGNYVDNDVTVDGSGTSRGANVWYAMPESYREAIALILLYSNQKWDDSYTVSNTAMADNPNVPLRIATQFLIYEIVTGLRDATTFELKDSNGYTDGDVFYNAGVANVSYTFRTWLLRLGLIGDEFKTARQHLLKNLDGNIAWKDPAQAVRQRERQMQQRLEQARGQPSVSAVEPETVPEVHQQQEEAPAFSMEELC